MRHKKPLISKIFDSSVRHKKSLISKRLQFFDYSVCHKKSLISNKIVGDFPINIGNAVRKFSYYFEKIFEIL